MRASSLKPLPCGSISTCSPFTSRGSTGSRYSLMSVRLAADAECIPPVADDGDWDGVEKRTLDSDMTSGREPLGRWENSAGLAWPGWGWGWTWG